MHPSNKNNCVNSDIWLENGSQEEYGCHKTQFTNSLREKVCFYCDQRKPASLEELSFSVILENAELLKGVDWALSHLPHRICWLIGRALNAKLISQAWQLVGFVSEYVETRPSWFDVDNSTNMFLSRFLLYCEVYQKLKPYMTSRSAGIHKILRNLSDVDSTYEDFWSKMTLAIRILLAETESDGFEHLKSMISAAENNVVLVQTSELTGQIRLGSHEYKSMKKLQRLGKIFACPVVFKPTTIGRLCLKSDEIPNLLDDIDPELIVDVDLKHTAWSAEDIDKLGRVLSMCIHLSSIYLRQRPAGDEVLVNVAPALSGLLSHHHQLQKIGLAGFNLAGTLAMYPLPAVESLRLRLCTFTEEDLSFMANRSDLVLKTLVIKSYIYKVHFPSLSVFIQNQATSLTTLGVEYPTLTFAEICHLLRIMAKFNQLEMLILNCVEEIDFAGIEKTIVDLMSIHSTRRFFFGIPTGSNVGEFEAEISRLNEVVKELCKINRRPPIKITADWPC